MMWRIIIIFMALFNAFVVGENLDTNLETLYKKQQQAPIGTKQQPTFVKKVVQVVESAARQQQGKLSAFGEQLTRLKTCYDRFQRCSKILHPAFCTSSNDYLSFYLWVKKVAHDILNEDGVGCPAELMAQFYKLGQLQQQQQQQPTLNKNFLLIFQNIITKP